MSRPRLRLFMVGGSTAGRALVSGVSAALDARFPGGHELEVVNVLLDPRSALEDGVFITPTLLKVEPKPPERFIGSMLDAVGALTI